MASLGRILPFLGIGKTPKAPALPDFSTLLTQAATNQATALADQQTAAKRRNATVQRNTASGMRPRDTILTSGSGAVGSAPTTVKTLLGQ